MRAPFQILAIPYRYENGIPYFCVLRRSDSDLWQFIAGGGEDKETPLEAAKREILEEGGIVAKHMVLVKQKILLMEVCRHSFHGTQIVLLKKNCRLDYENA